jgi:hypothetical protein
MAYIRREETVASKPCTKRIEISTLKCLLVALGDLVLACLPLDSRFAGSNPAEDDGFLRVIKSVARLPSEGK